MARSSAKSKDKESSDKKSSEKESSDKKSSKPGGRGKPAAASQEEAKAVVGGILGNEFSPNISLTRLKVRCPVPECGFECNEFVDMNVHMRMCHPERC